MSDSHVSIETRGAVSVLRLNRPPVNAIDIGFATAVADALQRILDSQPSAIVLTGTGKTFCAGLDLKTVTQYDQAQQRDMINALNRMLTALYGAPIPVVGAINGHAIAGGLCVLLACDYRVGPDNNAQFGLTEARAGVPFPAAPQAVVQHELPPHAVRFFTLYARNVDPREALRLGVFDELQPEQHMLDRAVEVAQDMAAAPADAFARVKRQFRGRVLDQLEDIIERGADPMLEAWLPQDAANASARLLRGAGNQ